MPDEHPDERTSNQKVDYRVSTHNDRSYRSTSSHSYLRSALVFPNHDWLLVQSDLPYCIHFFEPRHLPAVRFPLDEIFSRWEKEHLDLYFAHVIRQSCTQFIDNPSLAVGFHKTVCVNNYCIAARLIENGLLRIRNHSLCRWNKHASNSNFFFRRLCSVEHDGRSYDKQRDRRDDHRYPKNNPFMHG